MRTSEHDNLWLRSYQPARQDSVQLVCLPHAGGSASFYYPLAQALAPQVDVLAIQYPGRQDRLGEPAITDLHALARQVFEALRGRVDRPTALFGHSMGASIAFEVARILEQEEGVSLRHLFASGRRAPSAHRHERVHLEDDQTLVAEMHRLDGPGRDLLHDDEILRMILPAVRADYTAAETYLYQPGPPLRCPVTALVGDVDPKVTLDEARAWGEHTTGPFDLRVYSGGHFFLSAHQASVQTAIADLLVDGRASSVSLPWLR
ncbi:surfactin synthase thioesterase subunit [Micromonospora pisi]|uniref:Surfactin synthase thioesterase subunit n=1 Tax=Micromonospora pisi TaxID=589240 RepID=A0A495JSF2_9ACTN|nr:alpha/beta fold hydrolase [Micromonospora pisi]RKR91930.1 surfactin synthase thioesterase subunit [Micromonospora pisi]